MKSILFLIPVLWISACSVESDKTIVTQKDSLFYKLRNTFTETKIYEKLTPTEWKQVRYAEVGSSVNFSIYISFSISGDYNAKKKEFVSKSNRYMVIKSLRIPIVFPMDYQMSDINDGYHDFREMKKSLEVGLNLSHEIEEMWIAQLKAE